MVHSLLTIILALGFGILQASSFNYIYFMAMTLTNFYKFMNTYYYQYSTKDEQT